MTFRKKPHASNSLAEQELNKAEEQFEMFDQNIKSLTHDRMSQLPKREEEPQTKIAQSDIAKSKDVYVKPEKVIGSKEKFNERFRDEYNFLKEYVHVTAENKEIIGETIELWTKPFPGMPAEFWKVPCNTPVWIPRYLAEQIGRKFYHRLVMKSNNVVGSDNMGQYYGSMAADTTIERLACHPVSTRRSVFMGGRSFA
jgi:hypothetical protein